MPGGFLPGVRRAACFLALPILVALPAHADIDISEYEFKSALRDGKSRQAQREKIAADQAAEASRAAAAAARAEREAIDRQRAEAARPWPVRLTEQRCTRCHSAANYTRNAHTLVGWAVVALRMREFNGAQLSRDDLSIIVPYLAENYPARGRAALLEWSLMAALAALAPALAGFGCWLWRRSRS